MTPRLDARFREYGGATLAIAGTTAAAAAARAYLGVPDVEMLFLLGVLVVALTSTRRASVLAAVLAVGCYDFFFVPPPFTLDVSDARYLLTFAMMLAIGAVVGTLTLRLRQEQRAALARERRTAALYAFTRELAGAVDAEAVGSAWRRAAKEAFGVEGVLLVPERVGGIDSLVAAASGMALVDADRAVARWAFEHGRPAGPGTETFADAPLLCVPLRTWGECLAVCALRPPTSTLDSEHRALLDALARNAALALDRVRLADEARRAALRARSEELRSGLLSAVSHDLRTPLAAITGAGTMLVEGVEDPSDRRELASTVVEEAARLERLVSNLLEMTRLDSGVVEPKREWVPLVELVGSALARLERPLAGRDVAVTLPDALPLLSVDPVLMQQLFVNLLDNASKHTPAGTGIELSASVNGGTVAIDVADHGPGLPPGEEERVFERFHRAARTGVGGAGLGLAIARAIAHVHGGRLTAANRSAGGAVFRLTLPVATPQPAAEPGPDTVARRGVGA